MSGRTRRPEAAPILARGKSLLDSSARGTPSFRLGWRALWQILSVKRRRNDATFPGFGFGWNRLVVLVKPCTTADTNPAAAGRPAGDPNPADNDRPCNATGSATAATGRRSTRGRSAGRHESGEQSAREEPAGYYRRT